MSYMKTTVRELHINTSAVIEAVSKGETYIIERRGEPVAELRPFTRRVGRPLPDREAWIRKLPVSKTDAGRIMEEDRT
jgi:antitoxin (DNA-binding transcriptional repressor) of toxin-antitoxin stability system